MMAKMGDRKFYTARFPRFEKRNDSSRGLYDCHDPRTMKLQITRPALGEAFAAMGPDINLVTPQQMRSLVCAQCHVEYYFRNDESAGLKNYLVFPWNNGTGAEAILSYYNDANFTDFVNPIYKDPDDKSAASRLRALSYRHPRLPQRLLRRLPYALSHRGGANSPTITFRVRCSISPPVAPFVIAGARMRFAPVSRQFRQKRRDIAYRCRGCPGRGTF